MCALEIEAEEVDEEDYDDDTEDSRPARRGGLGKFILVGIIIAILIIAGFYGYVIYYKGEVEEIIPNIRSDNNGLIIDMQTQLSTGQASGTGDVSIKYEGIEIYSSDIDISNDYGAITVPYEEFLWGNGNYEITLTYDGESEVISESLSQLTDFHIAEYLNLTIADPTWETAMTDKGLDFGPTKELDSDLSVNVLVVDENNGNIPALPQELALTLAIEKDGSLMDTLDTQLYKTASHKFETDNYLGWGSGSYKFTVKADNTFINPNSPFYSTTKVIEKDINLVPVAKITQEVEPDEETHEATIPLFQSSVEVCFKSTDSYNDGNILEYRWDFDFSETEFDDIDNYQFDSFEQNPCHEYTSSGAYEVALQVVGDGTVIDPFGGAPIQEESKMYFFELVVTKGV